MRTIIADSESVWSYVSCRIVWQLQDHMTAAGSYDSCRIRHHSPPMAAGHVRPRAPAWQAGIEAAVGPRWAGGGARPRWAAMRAADGRHRPFRAADTGASTGSLGGATRRSIIWQLQDQAS